jgi:hypothetical protein
MYLISLLREGESWGKVLNQSLASKMGTTGLERGHSNNVVRNIHLEDTDRHGVISENVSTFFIHIY